MSRVCRIKNYARGCLAIHSSANQRLSPSRDAVIYKTPADVRTMTSAVGVLRGDDFLRLNAPPVGCAERNPMSMDDACVVNESPVCWGAQEIGRVIGRDERQTFHLLQIGEIKCARRVGGRWCAGREALLREFGV